MSSLRIVKFPRWYPGLFFSGDDIFAKNTKPNNYGNIKTNRSNVVLYYLFYLIKRFYERSYR